MLARPALLSLHRVAGGLGNRVHHVRRAILVLLLTTVRADTSCTAPASFCSHQHGEHHAQSLLAANEWVAATAAYLRHRGGGVGWAQAKQRVAQLKAFASPLFPARIREYPIFYPFCGVDLNTLHSFFPGASETFMVSRLPLGNFSCFLNA